MPRFRVPRPTTSDSLPESVPALVAAALDPANFFTGRGIPLAWEHREREEVPWEIFHGRLLDATQTRIRQTFETWNVCPRDAQGRPEAALLSVKLDTAAGRLHVTRAVECFAWEGYDAGDNVFLSREVRKWVHELVGTIELKHFADLSAVQDELSALLFQAVVGSSRLPLTSVEAPLPAFALGELGYFFRSEPALPPAAAQSFADLVQHSLAPELSWLEKAKLVELLLRSLHPDEISPAAKLLTARWEQLGHSRRELPALFRTLFNEVALSPYTGFVDTTLAFLQALAAQGFLTTEELTDFLSYVLRQLVRHLTAYDLITFHHRGANYPDALLLDAALKLYFQLIEKRPELFAAKGRRRRALRQAWLMWHLCAGLPVPDWPTSSGENARVLPPPFTRVPEEQILDPSRRTKRLYEGDRLADHLGPRGREALRQSITDLHDFAEVQELGIAVFLDRPLGISKRPGEPDRTLLFSHVAYSRRIAERRLRYLADDLGLFEDRGVYEACRQILQTQPPRGVPLEYGRAVERPGVVSLHDAGKVADDFLFLRTTAQTVRELVQQFDFAPFGERVALDDLLTGAPVLLLPDTVNPRGALTVYDAQWRKRLELQADPGEGYRRRAGHEVPAAGLRVLRCWEAVTGTDELREWDLRSENLRVRPCE